MITKKAEYAISTLVELADIEPGARITTREIARRRRIPRNLIVQLISLLRDAGWVVSTRGPGGGVALAHSPEKISLRQVVELVDGPISIIRCMFQESPCHNQADCSLRNVWIEAQSRMLEVLDRVTVKELAGKNLGSSGTSRFRQLR